MKGHNENKLYIVTCNCIIYFETFEKIKIIINIDLYLLPFCLNDRY